MGFNCLLSNTDIPGVFLCHCCKYVYIKEYGKLSHSGVLFPRYWRYRRSNDSAGFLRGNMITSTEAYSECHVKQNVLRK